MVISKRDSRTMTVYVFYIALILIISSDNIVGEEEVICSCEKGWYEIPFLLPGVELHSSCFFFATEVKNWSDAKVDCENRGGYLAEVIDDHDACLVNEVISDFAGIIFGGGGFWLGGTDQYQEGNWKWAHSDTNIDHQYPNSCWHAGHPSDNDKSNCLYLTSLSPWWEPPTNWYDGNCTSNYHYICQKPVNT